MTVFNLPRLSVDIDLDFAESCSREEMVASRKLVNRSLAQFMAAKGYTLTPKSKKAHALDSFVFSYVNTGGTNDLLKVEINYSLRVHVLPTVKRSVNLQGGFLESLVVLSLHPIEIFASKIVAYLSRSTLNNMVYYQLFDESELPLLKKCVIFYQAIAGNKPCLTIDSTRRITEHQVKTHLLPVIRRVDRFDLTVAYNRVQRFLLELLRLDERDKLFTEEFSRGQYRPELLFDDSKIVERVRNHPMVLWKMKNTLESK